MVQIETPKLGHQVAWFTNPPHVCACMQREFSAAGVDEIKIRMLLGQDQNFQDVHLPYQLDLWRCTLINLTKCFINAFLQPLICPWISFLCTVLCHAGHCTTRGRCGVCSERAQGTAGDVEGVDMISLSGHCWGQFLLSHSSLAPSVSTECTWLVSDIRIMFWYLWIKPLVSKHSS